ncbi:MAG TPA: hypothetical protein VKV03_19300 [Candidatus Binataceae bacterium]|nr:hypothetical protein [Candidatus Binataceae bacterium]
MRILIQPPDDTAGAHHAGDEVRKALETLQAAFIRTEGGGTVSSDGAVTGVIVVSSDNDAPKALDALGKAGIRASIG